MNEELKSIVVIYHGQCYDGFGGAYVAWKKFGNQAEYIATIDRNNYPAGVHGKEVYIIDISYSKSVTDELVANNKKVVILDHHLTSKETVLSVPGSIFSETDSGAKIAWKYFYPNDKVPALIEYLSDGDMWTDQLPYSEEVGGYIHIHKLEFSLFEMLEDDLEKRMDSVIEKGKVLMQQFNNLVMEHVEKAMLVEFEGYEVYAVNASSFLRSDLGHALALKKGPFSIVYRFEQDTLRISLRGDGTVDCTKLAEKYGGGGHHNAAAIIMKGKNPLPFKMV
ncbi:MAG: hypothetical protein ACAH17_02315 [Candidatus Paceibacterota bacterium]